MTAATSRPTESTPSLLSQRTRSPHGRRCVRIDRGVYLRPTGYHLILHRRGATYTSGPWGRAEVVRWLRDQLEAHFEEVAPGIRGRPSRVPRSPLQQQRLKAGLCLGCGQRPAEKGFRNCESCRRAERVKAVFREEERRQRAAEAAK